MDEESLQNLIQLQIKAGVDGIVPVGTTGESPTLDYEEHIRVIEAAIDFAGGKVKVLAGTGANSTTEAVYLTKAAEDAGADGSLQVARLTTDESGEFSLRLDPGQYLLEPVTPSGQVFPRATPQVIDVAPDSTTSIVVRYDTGIR